MIQLFSHQHWGEFNHVGFNAEAFQRTGGFQAQQATADNGTAFAAARARLNGVEVFDGAVNEAVLGFRTFNRWDPRVRACRHDQLIVVNRTTCAGVDHLLLAVNGNCALAH